jgi:hypothetical protein
MRIDIEKIRALREELRAFNRLPLDEVEFYENGKPMNIPPSIVEEFKFTGLNNADFIDTEFWKEQRERA